MIAIDKSYYNLGYAGKNLKNDKEIVLKAIEKDSSALQYASDYLKNDKEVVMIALN